ncbi:MAG: LPXTG cell wall anchor domain-containing protein [Motilibacteraceae bacterium]
MLRRRSRRSSRHRGDAPPGHSNIGRIRRGRGTSLVGAILALLTAVAGMVLVAGPASAHTPSVVPRCNVDAAKVSVNLHDYNTVNVSDPSKPQNTVSVIIDGVVQVDKLAFGASYKRDFLLDPTVTHSYTVSYVAVDDPSGARGWTGSKSGSTDACVVAPVAPGFTPPTCTTPATFTIPPSDVLTYRVRLPGQGKRDTAAGTYEVSTPGTVTIHARVTKSGSHILAGATADWTFQVGTPDCTVTTVAAPKVVDAQCVPGSTTPSTPTYTIPVTEGVEYQVDGQVVAAGTYERPGGQPLTVTAVAAPGYRLSDAATTSFPLTFAAAPDCRTVVTPATPVDLIQAGCVEGSSQPSTPTFTVPVSEGVDYELNGTALEQGKTYDAVAGTTVVLQVVARDGYRLAPGAPTSFPLDFAAAKDCRTLVSPVAPEPPVQSVCLPGSSRPTTPSYTVPDVPGVVYTVDGTPVPAGQHPATAGTTVTLVATPATGFRFASEVVTSFPLPIAAAPRCRTAPPAVVVPPSGLTVTKTVDKTAAVTGDTLSYGLVATVVPGAGGGVAGQSAVRIADTVPSGTTLKAGSVSCSVRAVVPTTCTTGVAGGVVTATAKGDLAVNDTLTLAFAVTVDDPAGGSAVTEVDNTGSVSSDSVSSTLSNTVVTAVTSVEGVIVEKPTTPPTPAAPAPVPVQPAPVIVAGSTLPHTGAGAAWQVGLAGALLALSGLGLLILGRRRRLQVD